MLFAGSVLGMLYCCDLCICGCFYIKEQLVLEGCRTGVVSQVEFVEFDFVWPGGVYHYIAEYFFVCGWAIARVIIPSRVLVSLC